MDFVTELSGLIMSNLQHVLLGMTVLLLLALIFFISINIKLSRLNKRYAIMMKGMDGVNVEQMLLSHIAEVKETRQRVEELTHEINRVDGVSKNSVQKVGVIRFNAFEDMGSDLSFAIALLDYRNNGVVISSIYSRTNSVTYAKPIQNGESSYFLTDEEKQALVQAKSKS